MLVVRREPSRRRLTWTMISTRFRDLAADGFLRDLDVAHQDHVFHTAQAFARAVGVERTHRSIVASVHCGEQVKALCAADFAKDDPVRAHTQGVLHQVALGLGPDLSTGQAQRETPASGAQP